MSIVRCRRGILLAGGSGSRMLPATRAVSKQMLPVYDKPMIYYPLSVLMLAGIREILIISSKPHLPSFQRLLGDGKEWGLSLQYVEQSKPRGIADAFLLGSDFIKDEPVALILGDNIFFGQGFPSMLAEAVVREPGATVFASPVSDPERYGVVQLDDKKKPLSIEEKPKQPKSNLAITGLYFYDAEVTEIARELTFSARGELEISDVNQIYLDRGQLFVQPLPQAFTWIDAGTPTSLLRASNLVAAEEQRQSSKIACLEEIAFRQGFLTDKELLRIADASPSEYGDYLRQVIVSYHCTHREKGATDLHG